MKGLFPSNCQVTSKVLLWQEYETHTTDNTKDDEEEHSDHLLSTREAPSSGRFDCIIGSDCLFFRDFHDDLVKFLKNRVSRTGIILLFQPLRDQTAMKFLSRCEDYFHVRIIENYSSRMSELRSQYNNSSSAVGGADDGHDGYQDDVHYPYLFILSPRTT